MCYDNNDETEIWKYFRKMTYLILTMKILSPQKIQLIKLLSSSHRIVLFFSDPLKVLWTSDPGNMLLLARTPADRAFK